MLNKSKLNSLNALSYLFVLCSTLPMFLKHINDASTARKVGAVDEGAIVSSVYMLAKNISYELEFFTKGHLYYYIHALLLKVVSVFGVEISFSSTAVFIRSCNIIYFYASVFVIVLVVQGILSLQMKGSIKNYEPLLIFIVAQSWFLLSAELVLKSNPDFFMTFLVSISFLFFVLFLIDLNSKYVTWMAVFFSLAMLIKISVIIYGVIYFIVLIFVEERSKIASAKNIILHFLSALLVLPCFYLTNSFNGFYADFCSKKFYAIAAFSIIAIVMALVAATFSNQYRRLIAFLKVEKSLNFVSFSLMIYLISTLVVSFHNSYSYHAFWRPLAVSIKVSFKEGGQVSFLDKMIKIYFLADRVAPWLILLIIGSVILYYFQNLEEILKKDIKPIFLAITITLVITVGVFNKTTFRYFHPYLILFLIPFYLLPFTLSTNKKLRYSILALFTIIMSYLNFSSKLWKGNEFFYEMNESLSLKLDQYLKIYDDEIYIIANKTVIVPKRFQNYGLVGESNISNRYNPESFPRPLWKKLPDLILLNQWELDRVSADGKEIILEDLIRLTKVPVNGSIYSDTPFVKAQDLKINIKKKYKLINTISLDSQKKPLIHVFSI